MILWGCLFVAKAKLTDGCACCLCLHALGYPLIRLSVRLPVLLVTGTVCTDHDQRQQCVNGQCRYDNTDFFDFGECTCDAGYTADVDSGLCTERKNIWHLSLVASVHALGF